MDIATFSTSHFALLYIIASASSPQALVRYEPDLWSEKVEGNRHRT